jgi:hypothetical protein
MGYGEWDEGRGARLTLNEAGYVVGQSRAAINRAVDGGVIEAALTRLGSVRVRRIGAAELRFLAIAAQVGRDFTPAARIDRSPG